MIKIGDKLVEEKRLLIKFISDSKNEYFVEKGKLMKRAKYFNKTYFDQNGFSDVILETSDKTMKLIIMFISKGKIDPEMFDDKEFKYFADYLRFTVDFDGIEGTVLKLLDYPQQYGASIFEERGNYKNKYNTIVTEKINDKMIRFMIDNFKKDKEAEKFFESGARFVLDEGYNEQAIENLSQDQIDELVKVTDKYYIPRQRITSLRDLEME